MAGGEKVYTIRALTPEERMSEEEACSGRQHPLFPELWETAITELSRTYERARAQMRRVFQGPLLGQSLLVETPNYGRCIVWRLWGEDLQVVRVLAKGGNSIVFESGNIITIPQEEVPGCTFILDQIVTELPYWSR